MDLGAVGVWWSGTWKAADGAPVEVAPELERIGYGTIWSTGGFNPGLSSRFERLLGATKRIAVASGIVNIWKSAPQELTDAVIQLEARHPGRFLLGIGASHGPLIENYSRPYSRTVEFLDALDSLEPCVAKERRVLAALGPRMLELAATRALGAHPYFVPPEHTERARKIMGDGPLLVPELTAVLEEDPAAARQLARTFTTGYLSLPNYANNLRSLGFSEEDLAGGGSDRLVDSVIAWGGADQIASRVREHREAGADQVCIQVVSKREGMPLVEYQALFAAIRDK